MTRLTRWVLRHKLIVMVFWLLVAVAGAMNAAAATHRMVNSFSLPGAKIAAIHRSSGVAAILIIADRSRRRHRLLAAGGRPVARGAPPVSPGCSFR